MRQATAVLTALSDVDNDEETRKLLSTLSSRQWNWRRPGAGPFAKRTKRFGVL
ncbi:hypothetical protein ACNKHR_05060 [Shigella flexneri]